MDPKPAGYRMLLAPPHGGMPASARLPAAGVPLAHAFPPLEETIVRPETREEIVRGRRMEAMPALPPHADQHFTLDGVLSPHIKEGYVGSVDLLTRPSVGSNFATDTCVRRAGMDPTTGQRYLEELSFEVVNEQSLADITERAEDLVRRGVRRVFAIFVKKGEIGEWSAAKREWALLGPTDTIADPLLARPLHPKELLDAAEARKAAARAMLAQGNPVLVEAIHEGIDKGAAQGIAEGVEAACDLLAIEITPERRAQMGALDVAGLRALLGDLRTLRRWPQ
jgi:hypothetical protein